MSAELVDLLASVRAHLAAATTAAPDLALLHLARARALFVQLGDEVRAVESMLVMREREAVARAAAPEQLGLPKASKRKASRNVDPLEEPGEAE
jgi:hypothetical protein